MADISQDNIKDLIKQFAAEDCVYLIAYVKVRDGVQHMCINDNLSGAHCLITAGGTCATNAIFSGVPAYTYEASVVTPLINMGVVEFLKAPPSLSRFNWQNWLAYQQWTKKEMRLGLPHKYLGETYERCRILQEV